MRFCGEPNLDEGSRKPAARRGRRSGPNPEKLAWARRLPASDLYLPPPGGALRFLPGVGILGTFFVSEPTAPFWSLGLGGMVSFTESLLAVPFIFLPACQVGIWGVYPHTGDAPAGQGCPGDGSSAVFLYTVFRYTGILGLTGGMARFVLKYLLAGDPFHLCTVQHG